MIDRPACQSPEACAARGAGHCRRCAGIASMARLREEPGFQDRLNTFASTDEKRAASQRIMRKLNKSKPFAKARDAKVKGLVLATPENVEKAKATRAQQLADKAGVPIEAVPSYRLLRANHYTTEQAVEAVADWHPNLAPEIRSAAPVTSSWAFDPLPMFGFDVIMADPPWLFQTYSAKGEAKAPQAHYDCMPTAEIAALPVRDLARRDCWLWLWATFAMVDDALEVLRAWGFTYSTGGTWIKQGESGKFSFGTGHVLRGNAELFLIGKMGNPPVRSKSIRNFLIAPRGEHSEKPDLAYETAEKLFGPAFRADLFSRRNRIGWQAWGKETGLLDAGGKPVKRQPKVKALPAPDPHQPGLFLEAAE